MSHVLLTEQSGRGPQKLQKCILMAFSFSKNAMLLLFKGHSHYNPEGFQESQNFNSKIFFKKINSIEIQLMYNV